MKKFLFVPPLLFLSLVTVAYAGSLSPSALPAATSYTLTDIYNRLTTNATATAGDHSFTPSGSPAASLKTLTQIYDAIPTITASSVKLGTSYLGVEGTLTPNGGTAGVGDVLAGKTAHLTGDWSLDSGTMTNVGAQTITPTTSNTTITAGYHSGAGYCAGDADLVTGNIRSGVNLFGVDGSSNVVDTTSGDAGAGDILATKKAWVDGAEVTGSMTNVGAQTITPTTSNTTITAGYHSGAGYCAGDADLVTGNIRSGVNLFGVDGSSNVVDTTSGDAGAGDILATKKAWVDGAEVTGNIATQTLSAANQTVNEGYYSATTLSAVDADLAVGNIKTGTTIFGVTGTFNGYPGTSWVPNGSGDGSTPLSQANCEAASGWHWFADANGDGDTTDPEDGLCVLGTTQTTGSWSGNDYAGTRENTYIAAYTCSGNFPTGTVASYSGINSSGNADTTWNAGDCALCQADCYDGKKDLPDQGSYIAPNAAEVGGGQGPITPEVLKDWKGTRLPTSMDYFGYCGYKNGYSAGGDNYETSCSSDTTFGDYGGMIGRTGQCIDLGDGVPNEWFSEQHGLNSARMAGGSACSYITNNYIDGGYQLRVVFRP